MFQEIIGTEEFTYTVYLLTEENNETFVAVVGNELNHPICAISLTRAKKTQS